MLRLTYERSILWRPLWSRQKYALVKKAARQIAHVRIANAIKLVAVLPRAYRISYGYDGAYVKNTDRGRACDPWACAEAFCPRTRQSGRYR